MTVRQWSKFSGQSAPTRRSVALFGHNWPGNGCGLRSRVVQALGTATSDFLFPADLFPERQAGRDMLSLAETRDATERMRIVAALEQTGGQVDESAKLLKVSRTTLWEKMQKLGS